MKTLLTCNLTDKTVRTGDGAWTPPVFTFGEDLTLALRLEETIGGVTNLPSLNVTALEAAIGFVDARPESRSFALQVGPGAQTLANTTAVVTHDCAPAALQAAINAKADIVAAYGQAKVTKSDGSWFIAFGTQAASVPMLVRDNTLWPPSIGRIGAVQSDEKFIHELRLVQLPVAFTDSSERILPAAPSIKRVQGGGSSGDVEWNEIQALTVRPDFRATYSLKRGYARTKYLSVDDGAEQIQSALEGVLGANFEVTDVGNFTAYIEFQGDFAGQGQDLLEVLALNPPDGDLTFTLPLDRAELAAWLRVRSSVTLPLEVRLIVLDPDNDAPRRLAPVHVDVTIQRPLVLPELAEIQETDWLRPPSPKDYRPRSTSTVFQGDKSAAFVIGNGIATGFAVDHPLATDDVEVWARENISNGRQLVLGTDFTVRVTSAGSVQVTSLTGAPGNAAWIVYVRAAEPIAAFAAGLMIAMSQVIGLDGLVEAFETRITNLETLLPDGTLVRPADPVAVDEIKIPERYLVFPSARLPDTFDPKTLETPTQQTLAALPRSPGLLPAIHDATITTFNTGALPASPTAGNVFQNTGAAAVRVPGGLGRRGEFLKVNEYAGYDGRVWYHVTRGSSASSSFFPSDFEQELIPPITFEADTWRAGQQFVLQFLLSVALLRSNSNAQWVLVIEHGTAPSDASPATTTLNLQNVVWNDTPLLTQRLIVSQLKQTRKFGVRIVRANNNAITGEKLVANAWAAAESVPATPAFVLRARLIRFDTENNEANASGFAYASITEAKATVG